MTKKSNEIREFMLKVAKARQLKELKPLDNYDLESYCETLINAAGIMQRMNEMACSSRLDLIENVDDTQIPVLGTDLWQQQVEVFCKTYLGLEMEFNGDPRGAAVKLIVHESLGDSWGDRNHLCVPTFDKFVC